MNRPIKFRAWDKINKRFENPQDFAVMGTGKYAIWYGQPHGYEAEKNDESRLEVMQFTGLTDKNGKEIYEGDVIGYPNPDIREIVRCGRWDNGQSYDDHEEGFGWYLMLGSSAEGRGRGLISMLLQGRVIGNIYENPELIA